MGTCVYLCRVCWQVRVAREDEEPWDHYCVATNSLRRFRWADRTDFVYIHNQALLVAADPPRCRCCGQAVPPPLTKGDFTQ